MSAVFDTVNHQKLLQILENRFNFTHTVLKLITSYLNNRSQFVSIDNYKSRLIDLSHGVPQGTCLGPILYLIYISGIYDVVGRHTPIIEDYADDHQLYVSFSPKSKIELVQAKLSLEQCIGDIRSFLLTLSTTHLDSITKRYLVERNN